MKKKFYLLLISFFIIQLSFAQNNTIKGTVVDKVNQPIVGATVRVDGTSHGSVTDMNGEFTIKDVSPGATVNFSFVGMKSKRFNITYYCSQISRYQFCSFYVTNDSNTRQGSRCKCNKQWYSWFRTNW